MTRIIKKPIIHQKLSHLSPDEINEIIDLYLDPDTRVSDIINTYKIDVRSSEFKKILPPIVHANVLCKYCNHPMWSEIPSKTNRYYRQELKCPLCDHSDSSNCNCISCSNIKKIEIERERQRKKNLLLKALDLSQYTPKTIQQLSYKQKIYLGALLRVGLSEDMEYIIPVDEFKEPFTPRNDYTKEIITELYRQKIIVIHPNSNINSFVDISEDLNLSYYPFQVCWHINLSFNEARNDTINSLMNPLSDVSFLNDADNLEIWKRTALEECLEYLEFRLDKVNLPIKFGDKTYETFNDLLNFYSVSQIYYLIYRSVGHALRIKEENSYGQSRMTKVHTSNIVIYECRNYGERACANNWNITSWRRELECPQSTLSKFLHNRILNIGDDGFICKPRLLHPEKKAIVDEKSS